MSDKYFQREVISRDCRCVRCGAGGETLVAHHVLTKGAYPTLRFDLRNGVTLCYACHLWAHANPVKALRMAKVYHLIIKSFETLDEWYSWKRIARNHNDHREVVK